MDSNFAVDLSDERDLRLSLGKRLHRLRKQKGMTMIVLGRASGCSQSFLSKVESGMILPSLPMLHRLARALDVKPSSLLSEQTHNPGDQADGRFMVSEQEP